MNTILYKGAVYVESSHKKCTEGTHWNDKKNQCMKLPSIVANAHRKAMSSTSRAKRLKGTAASVAHSSAVHAHKQAGWRALEHGFGDLSEYHETMVGRHSHAAMKNKPDAVINPWVKRK